MFSFCKFSEENEKARSFNPNRNIMRNVVQMRQYMEDSGINNSEKEKTVLS